MCIKRLLKVKKATNVQSCITSIVLSVISSKNVQFFIEKRKLFTFNYFTKYIIFWKGYIFFSRKKLFLIKKTLKYAIKVCHISKFSDQMNIFHLQWS